MLGQGEWRVARIEHVHHRGENWKQSICAKRGFSMAARVLGWCVKGKRHAMAAELRALGVGPTYRLAAFLPAIQVMAMVTCHSDSERNA